MTRAGARCALPLCYKLDMNKKMIAITIYTIGILVILGVIFLTKGFQRTNNGNNKQSESIPIKEGLIRIEAPTFFLVTNDSLPSTRIVMREADGSLKEVYSDNTQSWDLKVSPNFKFISWLENNHSDKQQLVILNIDNNRTTQIGNEVVQYEWSPDSKHLLFIEPNCPNNQATANGLLLIRTIATYPGVQTVSLNLADISDPDSINTLLCKESGGGVAGPASSGIGWLDDTTAWMQHINGVTSINIATHEQRDYNTSPHYSYLYSPWLKTHNVGIWYENQYAPLPPTKHETSPTNETTLPNTVTLHTPKNIEITLKLDAFGNLYYLSDNCVWRLDKSATTPKKYLCKNNANYTPSIVTTPNDRALISFGKDLYLCNSYSCEHEKLELESEMDYIRDIVILK